MRTKNHINVAPLVDVFLVLIVTVLVTIQDVNATSKAQSEAKTAQQTVELNAESQKLIDNVSITEKEVLGLEKKIANTKSKLENQDEKIKNKDQEIDLAPKTNKKQLEENLASLKKELFVARRFANDKVTIDLYFSNTNKIYWNASQVDLSTLIVLVDYGFKYNVSLQSNAQNSNSYQNFYRFCTNANAKGYAFKCQ